MRFIALSWIILMAFIGYADDAVWCDDSVLKEHYQRVNDEQQRIEKQHHNCIKCHGKSVEVESSICKKCSGVGMISRKQGSATISTECEKCKGKGRMEVRKPCSKCCPYIKIQTAAKATLANDKKDGSTDKKKCTACSGKGNIANDVPCKTCGAKGTIYTPPKRLITGWSKERRTTCSTCAGKGKKIQRVKCGACKGSGYIRDEQRKDEEAIETPKEGPLEFDFDIVQWIVWSAEHDDARSQYCLGVMHIKGDRVKKSFADAEKWINMSAEKNYVFSHNLLAARDEYQSAKLAAQKSAPANTESKVAATKSEEKSNSNIGIKQEESDCLSLSHCQRNAAYELSTDYAATIDFQLRKLFNGNYNYVVTSYYNWIPGSRYEIQRYNNDKDNGVVYMIVFNNDSIRRASESFRDAAKKIREWLEIGKRTGKTLDSVKSLNISFPTGCSLRIPKSLDKWYVYETMADIPKHKQMRTNLSFGFGEQIRVLLVSCGDVKIRIKWQPEHDEEMLNALYQIGDIDTLYRNITGQPSDQTALVQDSNPPNLPDMTISKQDAEWSCGQYAISPIFKDRTYAALCRCSDGSYNFSFNDADAFNHITREGVSHHLIFPNNTYTTVYESICTAYRIAIRWRDIAKRMCIKNICKEIYIPCPGFVPLNFTYGDDFITVLNKAQSAHYSKDQTTPMRFWFSVDTNDDKSTMYSFWFGNEKAAVGLLLDEASINALHTFDPSLGLEAFRTKVKEEAIFK